MSEDKTYILKPGVTFGESNDKDYVHMYPYFTASMRADIHKSIFDQCFTEFSFDATRKQIEELAKGLHINAQHLGYEYFTHSMNGEARDFHEKKEIGMFVDALLALLGGANE